MKQLVLLVVMACGGSQPARSSEPIENRAEDKRPPTPPSSSSRPGPIANAAEATAEVAVLMREFNDVDGKLDGAITAVPAAATDVERQLAIKRLEQLQQRRDEIRMRMMQAYEVIERDTGERPIINACTNHPLARCP
jgi:hypothetical protein